MFPRWWCCGLVCGCSTPPYLEVSLSKVLTTSKFVGYTSQCWTTLGPAMRNYVSILWVTCGPCTTNMQNGWCLKKVFIQPPQYSSRLVLVGKHIHKYSRYQNLNMHIQDRIQIPFQRVKALPGFFLCISSSLTCLKKPVFNNWDLLRWKVPARLPTQAVLGSSKPAKGTHQPVTISKKWKNPSSAFPRKRTGVQALTGLGHRSQIMEGPVLRPFSYT